MEIRRERYLSQLISKKHNGHGRISFRNFQYGLY